MAAEKGHVGVCRVLLEIIERQGVDFDWTGWPALVLAAGQGHLEVCRLLFEHGVDINDKANTVRSGGLLVSLLVSVPYL